MARFWQYTSCTQNRAILLKTWGGTWEDVSTEKMRCPACVRTILTERARIPDARNEIGRFAADLRVYTCEGCAWWAVFNDTWDSSCGASDRHLHFVSGIGATLSAFSPLPSATMEILRSEVESHLRRHGKSTAWKAMEQVTASLLSNFGYSTVLTARSGDKGVDTIVRGNDGMPAFVQIKHSRDKVGTRIVRELVGTMQLGGASEGLLVTSSGFTRNAAEIRKDAELRGFRIELVDGQSFLDALNLAQRTSMPEPEEILRFVRGVERVNILSEDLQF